MFKLSFILAAAMVAHSIQGLLPNQSGTLARDVKPEKAEQLVLGEPGAYFVVPFDKDTVFIMDGKKVKPGEFKADDFVWVYRKKDTAVVVLGFK